MSEPERVAVIGMAGRFPGAADVEGFWANLVAGRDCLRRFEPDELRAAGVPEESVVAESFVPVKGWLEDADCFDHELFGYSPREAEVIDPQQRVLLECAWAALEAAGVDPQREPARIGVFAGSSLSSYLLHNLAGRPDVVAAAGAYQTLLGNDKDFLSTRVSFKLGLTGPSVTVQTACSTSLSAVHLATQSILAGECDIALAGGVSVSAPLADGYHFTPGGILSADGTCRPFSSDAAGTVPGNGVGVVVLRRLSEAVEAGDDIHAVILGSAMNNDGSAKIGYTAPSVDGQAEVIAEALAYAGVDPGSVGLVQTHGTGTPLGDPVELAALQRVLDVGSRTQPCLVGAVKANVGHLDAAAGVVSLIAAVLALGHGVVPPICHLGSAHPALELDERVLSLPGSGVEWERAQQPRRAGVSSFGIGGTNVHVVLEEAPALPRQRAPQQERTLALSAASPAALGDLAVRLADHLQADPSGDLAAVATTLAHGRRALGHRLAVTAGTPADAAAALRSGARRRHVRMAASPRAAFLFPGQGAQFPGMAAGLYADQPAYREVLDHGAARVRELTGVDVRELVLADPGDERSAAALRQTGTTQPALFVVEYAAAQLWGSVGVAPAAMLGHSVGELVAATLAGVFELDDALGLVVERGRLAQLARPGVMLSVLAAAEMVAPLLTPDVEIAAVNAPGLCVVGGPGDAVELVRRRLHERDIATHELRTSHAFHTAAMELALERFRRAVAGVARKPPRIPFCSNVTGTWVDADQAVSPDYWAAHLRQTVRFSDALAVLLADPDVVPVEVGPGDALRSLVAQSPGWAGDRPRIGTISRPRSGEPAPTFRTAMAQAWEAGLAVDAAALAGSPRQVVGLPAYPFRRNRFWVAPGAQARSATDDDGERRERPLGDWFSTPTWTRVVAGERVDPAGQTWVLLGDDDERLQAVRQAAEAAGVVVVAATGRDPRALTWRVDDEAGGGLDMLWRVLVDRGTRPDLLVVAQPDDVDVQVGLGLVADAASRLAATREGTDDPLEIVVLTLGAHDVTGAEPLDPVAAALASAAVVLGHELVGVRARSVDVAPVAQGLALDIGPGVVAAVADGSQPAPTAVRADRPWQRGFAELGRDDVPADTIRPGGLCVVTGGLGGVGLAMAERLALRRPDLRLALLARRPLHEHETSTRERVAALAEAGIEVSTYAADLTDEQDAADVMASVVARHGPVHAVVHCAGVPSQGIVLTRTEAGAAAVAGPKWRAATAVLRACDRGCLDLVLLTSSTSAVLGGPGQFDYAAANAMLATLAEQLRREGLPAVAVLWDTWRNVGMARGATEALHETPVHSRLCPLVDRIEATGPGAWQVHTTLSTATDWVVAEHRLSGHGLVPGTAWLELAREAVAAISGQPDPVVRFEDVVFLSPALVPDGHPRRLVTSVTERAGGYDVTVRTVPAKGVPTAHATATVRLLAEEHSGEPLLTADEHSGEHQLSAETYSGEQRLTAGSVPGFAVDEVLDTEDSLKRRLGLDRVESDGELVFTFGERWRCLRSMSLGRRRLVVELELPAQFAAELTAYRLHPALLDVAGAAARVFAQDVYYLPLGYRSLTLVSGLTPQVTCDVRVLESDGTGETFVCDMDLLDPSGRVLAYVRGFSIKRINDTSGLAALVQQDVEELAAGRGPSTGANGLLAGLSAGLTPKQGCEALDRLLGGPLPPPQVVVTRAPIATLVGLSRALSAEAVISETENLGLPEASHARPDLATPYAAPQTDLERAVCAVWEEVLGVTPVGVDDDFFALGGHSLAGVQIGARLRQTFGVSLDLADFFESPTVAATARALAVATDTDEPPLGLASGEWAGADESVPDVDELSDDEVDALLRELMESEQ